MQCQFARLQVHRHCAAPHRLLRHFQAPALCHSQCILSDRGLLPSMGACEAPAAGRWPLSCRCFWGPWGQAAGAPSASQLHTGWVAQVASDAGHSCSRVSAWQKARPERIEVQRRLLQEHQHGRKPPVSLRSKAGRQQGMPCPTWRSSSAETAHLDRDS